MYNKLNTITCTCTCMYNYVCNLYTCNSLCHFSQSMLVAIYSIITDDVMFIGKFSTYFESLVIV